MRVTQGTFSYLPDLSDGQITKQLEYCLNRGIVVPGIGCVAFVGMTEGDAS